MTLDPPWWSLDQIADELSRRSSKPALIYYELAPTGRFHPGLLRTALQIAGLNRHLLSANLPSATILRLNDRYALRSHTYAEELGAHLLIPLTALRSPVAGFPSFAAWSINEILTALDISHCVFDHTLLVSQMYANEAFRELAREALCQKDALLNYIGKSQKRPPEFFHPLCRRCQRMYAGFCESFSANGTGRYRCNACEAKFQFDIFQSPGLINFKIESAITWMLLGVSVDVHGTDQKEAARVSGGVYEMMFQKASPIRYCINCVLGEDGKIMHKSHCNFLPVLDYPTLDRESLIRILSALPNNFLASIKSIHRKINIL